MNTTAISLTTLLERMESQIETADGRTVRLCRDARGNFWVVDDAERAVPLSEFASDLAPAARLLGARERAKAMRALEASVKGAIARAMRALRFVPKPAHA